MSAPRILRANYADLYGADMLPALEELFRYNLAQHPRRRDLLFKVEKTDQSIWQYSELHDMPLLKQISEGEDYSFESLPAGSNKTFVPAKFGLGVSISEEAVEDGKISLIGDAIAKMAKSARESQEIQAMDVINNGFTTQTTADGMPIFSTAHILPSGDTFRNKLAVDADLSDTSLKQALVDFEVENIGDSGIIYRQTPRYLLVHPDNKRLAKELVGSELSTAPMLNANGTDYVSNTNNMNSLKEEGLIVISSPHLVDADSWYLLAEPSADQGLRIISRKGIETKAAGSDVGFINDSILYKCRYREAVGAVHPRGLFGTTGA